MPELIFLPDREGADKLSAGAGLARMEGATLAALGGLSERMLTRDDTTVTAAEETAAWRGALATVLLLNLWDDAKAAIRILTMDQETSPFAAMVMAARPAKERKEPLRLVLLEQGNARHVVGLVSRRKGLIPAADPSNLRELLPGRVTWYDREAGRFLDPTPLLNERDGELLVRRLHLMRLQSPEVNAFIADLVKEQGREGRAAAHAEAEALDALFLRVQAVVGLEGEGFGALSTREERYVTPTEDPFLRCFTDAQGLAGEALGVQRIYCWQGIPFARSSVALGFRGTNHPQEQEALGMIRQEISLLGEYSRRWQLDAASRIRRWLERVREGRSFSSAAAEAIANRCDALAEAGRQLPETAVLTWPWDEASDAVRILLQESLGEGFAFSGSPFTERLTKLKGAGEALGDTALRLACRSGADGYLPPLSPELAACLYRVPEGQGFVAEQFYLLPEEDGSVTATFLLRGEGEAALVRRYAPEEIDAVEGIPTIAVWPSVPFADHRWRSYFVYLHGADVTVKTVSDNRWVEAAPDARGFAVLRATSYPACLLVYRGEACLGAIPNALPAAAPESLGEAVVALDIGASGISTMLRMGEAMEPLSVPCLVRTLLQGPEASAMDEEFMAPEDIAPVLPTCMLLSGDGISPLTDGHLFAPTKPEEVLACRQTLLSGSLAWRNDGTGARARTLLLHQLMLQASLAAMLRGASSVSWRLALPGGDGTTLWQWWVDPANTLAVMVAEETGLPLTRSGPPVTWAPVYRALGAQLRDESFRGSFMALDFSGGNTGAHLWLRSMNRPAVGYTLQGGMQALLVGALAEHPGQISSDFEDCPDETLRKELGGVAALLVDAGPAMQQVDRALLLLDLLLDRHVQTIAAHMNARYAAGRMTWLQALLLEHFAMALMLSGMLLEQAASDGLLSHHLPEDLTFCLSGRGSHLLSSMPAGLENGLAYFVRAVLNERHPVRSMMLRQSPESKLDVCRGLCQMTLLATGSAEEPPVPPVRSSASFAELVMRFLVLLRAAYPQACELLHAGLFDPQGMMTVTGEFFVRQVAALRYGEGVDIASSLSAALRDLRSSVEPAEPPATVS